jgi:thiol-disulfide isomerase/thioredoxin
MKSFSTLFLLTCLLLVAIASAQTTRRVVIEEFTGAWCGACPDAAIKIEEIEHDYPDNTIGLAWHEWDDLEIPEWTPVKTLFGVSSYPGGAVQVCRSIPHHPVASFVSYPFPQPLQHPGHCLRGHAGSVI